MDKKVVQLVLVVIVTVLLLFLGKYFWDYYQDNYSVMGKYAIQVNDVEEMEEIIASEEVVYVYMGRPDCGDSDVFEAYFPDLLKEYEIDNLDNFYYFEIKSLTDEYSENQVYKDILENKFDMKYTPTLAKYVDGELVIKSEWTPEKGYTKDEAITFIEESGMSD